MDIFSIFLGILTILIIVATVVGGLYMYGQCDVVELFGEICETPPGTTTTCAVDYSGSCPSGTVLNSSGICSDETCTDSDCCGAPLPGTCGDNYTTACTGGEVLNSSAPCDGDSCTDSTCCHSPAGGGGGTTDPNGDGLQGGGEQCKGARDPVTGNIFSDSVFSTDPAPATERCRPDHHCIRTGAPQEGGTIGKERNSGATGDVCFPSCDLPPDKYSVNGLSHSFYIDPSWIPWPSSGTGRTSACVGVSANVTGLDGGVQKRGVIGSRNLPDSDNDQEQCSKKCVCKKGCHNAQSTDNWGYNRWPDSALYCYDRPTGRTNPHPPCAYGPDGADSYDSTIER